MLRDRGLEARNAIPILVAHLSAKEPRVAARAAEALGTSARPANDALAALEKARHSEQAMVTNAATAAIQKIQSRSDQAKQTKRIPPE